MDIEAVACVHNLQYRFSTGNFTHEEIDTLLNGVEKRKGVLFSKFGSVVTFAAKEKAWQEVTHRFCSLLYNIASYDMYKSWPRAHPRSSLFYGRLSYGVGARLITGPRICIVHSVILRARARRLMPEIVLLSMRMHTVYIFARWQHNLPKKKRNKATN